jgi:hypothetical protein
MAEPNTPNPRASRRVLGVVGAKTAPLRLASSGLRAACFAAAVLAAGCGNTIYAFKANSAANKVEEAHELGAEKLAPYEYYYAKAHLEKAQEEAAEADYSDAINLAETSEEYADKAIRLTKAAQRGAGR